jgi:hypothetical protein
MKSKERITFNAFKKVVAFALSRGQITRKYANLVEKCQDLKAVLEGKNDLITNFELNKS